MRALLHDIHVQMNTAKKKDMITFTRNDLKPMLCIQTFYFFRKKLKIFQHTYNSTKSLSKSWIGSVFKQRIILFLYLAGTLMDKVFWADM